MKNKLENLENKFNGVKFIKSFNILNHNPNLIGLKKKFIELVYSYNSSNKPFYQNYTSVAETLNCGEQTIKNIVSELSKLEYIITENTKNYNVDTNEGGSSTKIVVNVDAIIKDITIVKTKEPVTEENQNKVLNAFAKIEAKKQPKIEPVVAPIKEVEVIAPVKVETKVEEIVEIPTAVSGETFNVEQVLAEFTTKEEFPTFKMLVNYKLNKKKEASTTEIIKGINDLKEMLTNGLDETKNVTVERFNEILLEVSQFTDFKAKEEVEELTIIMGGNIHDSLEGDLMERNPIEPDTDEYKRILEEMNN
tara:strand:- start:11358 stop:12278 length:921 start_codon:yes stop_codon:yes gene_type:complete